MKGITEENLRKLLRGCNVDFENKNLFATLIGALEEIGTPSDNKPRPMGDAQGGGSPLVADANKTVLR